MQEPGAAVDQGAHGTQERKVRGPCGPPLEPPCVRWLMCVCVCVWVCVQFEAGADLHYASDARPAATYSLGPSNECTAVPT